MLSPIIKGHSNEPIRFDALDTGTRKREARSGECFDPDAMAHPRPCRALACKSESPQMPTITFRLCRTVTHITIRH